MKNHIKHLRTGLTVGLFIAPNLLLFLVFTLIPVVWSFILSFYDWDTFHPARFVGFANFTELLGFVHENGKTVPSDPEFWYTLFNTFFMMTSIPFVIGLSLLLAVLLNSKMRGENLLSGKGWQVFIAGVAATVGMGAAIAARISGASPLAALSFGVVAGALAGGVASFLGGQRYSAAARALANRDWIVLRIAAGAVIGLLVMFCVGSQHGQWLLAGALGVIIGPLVASALDRVNIVARAIFFLPSVTSGVAVYFLWKWILNGETGPISRILACVGIAGPDWLHGGIKLSFLSSFGIEPLCYWAKPALMMMGAWGAMGGGHMIMYLAALQGIDSSLYEAAEIDGANWWQKFRNITLPLLAPTTFFILITSIMGAFHGGVESALVMTGGGPDLSTTTIGYYVYSMAFHYFRMGYAAAVAWILFAVVFALTLLLWRRQKGAAN